MAGRDPRELQDELLFEDASPEFALDPKKYLLALRRHWAVLLLCAILGGILAFVRFSLTEKEYRTHSTIQIERRRFTVMAMGQSNWVEDWWNREYYPTQYRLLTSRGMAERVILNLRLHQNRDFAGEKAELIGADPSHLGALPAEQAALLASLAAKLQSNLTVQPIEETQLVQLTIVSPSPELAARIANGYAEAFIDWTSETRSTTVRKASTFLSGQIEQIRTEIDEQNRRLQAMEAGSDFALDPQGQALLERQEMLGQQYNAAIADRISREAAYRELVETGGSRAPSGSDPEIRRLRDEISGLEAEYETKLETFRPEWPAMLRLQDEIGEKREQLRRLRSETAEVSVEEARSAFQKAQRQEAFLEAELRRVAERVRDLNSEAVDYMNQRMQLETAKDLLKTLVERQSETEVASRIQGEEGSNARIVDRAVVPSAPFKPILQKDLTIAILTGLLFGAGGIALLTFLDRSIKTPEELERVTGLPVLAVITDISDRKGRRRFFRKYGYDGGGYGYGYGYGYAYGYGATDPELGTSRDQRRSRAPNDAKIELLPHDHPRLAVSEAYRSLRTALLLSSASELRAIAITSAEPGEGKTATSTNLAVVMAQLGRRVLLVDADMRRPRLHKVFGLSNRSGLVTYLTGPPKDELELQETNVPNLWACTAGPIPPNPSELLASERMREYLEKAREEFDFVILDTPPVLPVADAVILGTQVDGVVVCSLAGRLNLEDARACRERLNYEHIRVFGAVLNRYRRVPGMSYDRRYAYYGVYEERPAKARTDTAA